MSTITVQEVSWTHASQTLAEIRHKVFVIEQAVPVELELDGLDAKSRHVQASTPEGVIVGTGRLLPDGHIGRVAVLPEWRGLGIGQALMKKLIDCARTEGFDRVQLNAQTSALTFYKDLGFIAHGDEFLDAGIPHRAMSLHIDSASGPLQEDQS